MELEETVYLGGRSVTRSSWVSRGGAGGGGGILCVRAWGWDVGGEGKGVASGEWRYVIIIAWFVYWLGGGGGSMLLVLMWLVLLLLLVVELIETRLWFGFVFDDSGSESEPTMVVDVSLYTLSLSLSGLIGVADVVGVEEGNIPSAI
jgi:hypothetical protein